MPAESECPGEAEFVARVRERSVHHQAATPGELARSFIVSVTLDGEGALGRVDFIDTDGTAVSRSVRGATCDEVVSGIALVTALAIDARATEPPEAPAPASIPRARSEAPPPPPANPRAEPVPATPRYTLGLGSGWVSYAGPSGALGVDLFFAASLWEHGPSARISALHLRSELVSPDGREGRLRVYGGKLEACPVAFPLRALFLEPCAGTSMGVLSSAGVPSAGLVPASKRQIWWDLALAGRLGVVVEDTVVLELQGELGVPLFRPSFGFDENAESPVFEVPGAGGSVRAGAGIRFP